MPFDSNGNASLVPGYLATTGQTILANQHNPPLEDIAGMLSQLVLRSGIAPMSGNLNFNSFKPVNLGTATNSGDAVSLGQVQLLLSAISTVPTGAVEGFDRKTPPAGWVARNGGTIGNASSGATTRANADTEALFTLYWNEFTNAERAIQDNTGAATTRGASAAADFAAGKRMPLFDSRSRFPRGADDGLGFDTSLTVGATQADALKSHTHTGTTNVTGAHSHLSNQANWTVSGGGNSISGTGGVNSLPTSTNGDHAHTFTTDATGDALETRPRSTVLLYCIKL
jgi:hypothetical protein